METINIDLGNPLALVADLAEHVKADRIVVGDTAQLVAADRSTVEAKATLVSSLSADVEALSLSVEQIAKAVEASASEALGSATSAGTFSQQASDAVAAVNLVKAQVEALRNSASEIQALMHAEKVEFEALRDELIAEKADFDQQVIQVATDSAAAVAASEASQNLYDDDFLPKYNQAVTDAATVASSKTSIDATKTSIDTIKTDIDAKATQITADTATTTDAKNKAVAWADTGEDTEVETGKYSAKHWALKAEHFGSISTNSIEFRGGFDASSGTAPPTPDPETPHFYKITAAGAISGIDYSVGDNIIWDVINDVWFKIDNNPELSDNPDLNNSSYAASTVATKILADRLAAFDALPAQTGQSGKALFTDGSQAAWQDIVALPDQAGHATKFLTTDGINASWAEVDLSTLEDRIEALELLTDTMTFTINDDLSQTVAFDASVEAKDFVIPDEDA